MLINVKTCLSKYVTYRAMDGAEGHVDILGDVSCFPNFIPSFAFWISKICIFHFLFHTLIVVVVRCLLGVFILLPSLRVFLTGVSPSETPRFGFAFRLFLLYASTLANACWNAINNVGTTATK